MYMNNLNNKTDIGLEGEGVVINRLIKSGYILYKRNYRKIGLEIDIIMYKFINKENVLDIRVVEVKTRNKYQFNLHLLSINKKWFYIQKYMFSIKSEILSLFIDSYNYLNFKTEIHFDLAMVKKDFDNIRIYSYIKDVNLLM